MKYRTVNGQKNETIKMADREQCKTGSRMNKSNTDDEGDDDESETETERKILVKIHEYIDGFTVHGLTKIFHGNKIESAFWLIVVVSGLLLTISVTQNLFRKYFRYEVYTEVRSQVTNQNYFPTVTICENRLLRSSYFAYCGEPMGPPTIQSKKQCLNQAVNYSETIEYEEFKLWSNSLFKVTWCSSWDGKKCVTKEYFKSLRRFNNSCIQFNYEGTIHDLYSHIQFDFEFIPPPMRVNKTPQIVVIPHDSRIHEIDLTSTVAIQPHNKYYIQMEKTHVKRLPHPYPSKCSDKKSGDIFPGKYERRQCIESYVFKDMYRKCGQITDHVRQYLPSDFLQKYHKNISIEEAIACMRAFKTVQVTDMKEECPFPCDELEFTMGTSFTSVSKEQALKDGDRHVYHIDLNYRIVDTYRIFEEEVLYNWDQMACEIGGFIGLVIGASIISFFEVAVCVGMKLFNGLRKRILQRKRKSRASTLDGLCLLCKHKISGRDIDDTEEIL